MPYTPYDIPGSYQPNRQWGQGYSDWVDVVGWPGERDTSGGYDPFAPQDVQDPFNPAVWDTGEFPTLSQFPGDSAVSSQLWDQINQDLAYLYNLYNNALIENPGNRYTFAGSAETWQYDLDYLKMLIAQKINERNNLLPQGDDLFPADVNTQYNPFEGRPSQNPPPAEGGTKSDQGAPGSLIPGTTGVTGAGTTPITVNPPMFVTLDDARTYLNDAWQQWQSGELTDAQFQEKFRIVQSNVPADWFNTLSQEAATWGQTSGFGPDDPYAQRRATGSETQTAITPKGGTQTGSATTGTTTTPEPDTGTTPEPDTGTTPEPDTGTTPEPDTGTTTTPEPDTEIDWNSILRGLLNPETPATTTTTEGGLTPEQQRELRIQDIMKDWNPLTNATDSERAVWDLLNSIAGEQGGLSDEEKNALRENLKYAMADALERGAFKGAGQSSKVAYQMARIAAEGELSIAEQDRLSKSKAANRRLQAAQGMIAFETAMANKNYQKAQLILLQEEQRREDARLAFDQEFQQKYYELQKTDTLAKIELNKAQLRLTKQMQSWQISIGERQFTESQKQFMINAGFTQQQIDLAEQDLIKKYELAEKNWALAERQVSLDELKNEQGYGLQQRMLALQEELGLRGADLDEEKVRLMRDQIEREFQIRLDDQAFDQWLQTEQLDQSIIDLEWKRNFQEREAERQFWLSDKGLDLQRTLGLTEIEVNSIIQREWMSVDREKQLWQKLIEEEKIDLGWAQLEAQIDQWRKENKSRDDALFYGFLDNFIPSFNILPGRKFD